MLGPTTDKLISVLILILDVLVIVSIVRGSGSTTHKVLWTLVIILLPALGLVLYFLLGRGPQDAPLWE